VGALGLRYQPQRAGKPSALFSWIVASGMVSQRTPHKTKSVRGAFAPQPSCYWRRPVLVGSLSLSVGSFRLLSLRPFHFATATGLHCADSRLSVILIILMFIAGGYLRNPCSARARLAPLGLVLVGSTPHPSGLACLVGALNAKRKKI